jgi:hypothetical protein
MRLRLFAVAAALVTASLAAHADTINDFSVSGTFDDGATLSGTIAIDVTTGQPIESDSLYLAVSSPINMTYPESYITTRGIVLLRLLSSTYGEPNGTYIDIFPDATTLIGYTGGALYSESLPGPISSGDPGLTQIFTGPPANPSALVTTLTEGELTLENPPAVTPAFQHRPAGYGSAWCCICSLAAEDQLQDTAHPVTANKTCWQQIPMLIDNGFHSQTAVVS